MSKNTFKGLLAKNKAQLNTRTAKVGGYSFIIAVIVLAVVIAVNILVSAIPASATEYDISAAQLYTVTSSTKSVANALEKDVTIYWISQAAEESSVVGKLLNVYDELSDHINVEKRDPDVYPTFAAQYTDDTVNNNSLVVVNGDRSRYIDYYDIYVTDYSDYYTTGSVAYSFDAESQITSAIDYVVSDDLPQAYLLSGHGEADLSDTFADALQDANIEVTEGFSLLTIDEIPEECDAIIINSPTSDISDVEAEMLTEYLEDGGHLMVFTGPQVESGSESGSDSEGEAEDETLENAEAETSEDSEEDSEDETEESASGSNLVNLESVLENCGVTPEDGIVIESDTSAYAFGYPYVLLPTIDSSDITDKLIDAGSYILVPIGKGLTVGDAPSDVTVTTLLESTSASFSKIAGFALTTYEEEDGDIAGPFALAVSVEYTDSDGKMIWVSTDYMTDDTYNSYSSGANIDFVMNAISWMVGETESISIRAKSLDYSYLTISDSSASLIKAVMIVIVPLIFLAMGIAGVVSRRKK